VTRLWTGQLRNCGSMPSRGKRFISFPKHAEHLWGPPSLIFRGYWKPFAGGKVAGM